MKTLITFTGKFSFLVLFLFLFDSIMWAQTEEMPDKLTKEIKVITESNDGKGKIIIEIQSDDFEKIVEELEINLETLEGLEGIDDEIFAKLKATDFGNVKVEVEKIIDVLHHDVAEIKAGAIGFKKTVKIIEAEDGSLDTLVLIESISNGNEHFDHIDFKHIEGEPCTWISKEIETIINDSEEEKNIHKIIVVEIKLDDVSDEEELILHKLNNDEGKNESSTEVLHLKDLKLLPNPSNGSFVLNFDIKTKGKTTISITNMGGQLVYEEILRGFKGNYNKTIDLKEFDKGFYLLQVTQGNKVINKKIALQ